jgi:hypothetical protein
VKATKSAINLACVTSVSGHLGKTTREFSHGLGSTRVQSTIIATL